MKKILLCCFLLSGGFGSFYLHHAVSDADMGLNVLRGIRCCFQLFPEGCHEDPEGCYIIFPASAPDILGNIGVGQDLADVFGKETQKLIFNGGQVEFLAVHAGAASGIVYG